MMRRGQSGISLVEVLIAIMLLAIVVTMSLVMYDSTRRSFKVGDNLTEQQQLVRIAFDKLTRDLRLAGLNHNPDGNRSRPDEQIEAAYAGAIAFRADFDRDDPFEAVDPESSLDGGAFLSVSTGNDEIVIFSLGKSDRTSIDEVFFRADVSEPRDASEEDIRVERMALVHDDPPYTLYRTTIARDGTPGNPAPLAENIRSLNFTYYDALGSEIDPVDGGDSPGDRADRAAIRRIGIEIEGLTRDGDPRWVDAEDPDPETRNNRKFRLAGDITPRNLGLVGLKDRGADTAAPGAPAQAPDLHTGHCGGLLLHWPPNPPDDEVAYYRVRYGVSPPGILADQRSSAETFYYLGGLQDGRDYVVGIEAVDSAGNSSATSPTSSIKTVEDSVPEQVAAPVVTSQAGRIDLVWDPVAYNTTSIFGDPGSPRLRELSGYRIYRGPSDPVPLIPANRIADETVIGPWQTTAYSDTTVVDCASYFYQIVAVDRCGVEGQPSDAISGISQTSGAAPEAPINVQAFPVGMSTVRLYWDPVRENTDGQTIFVDRYGIFTTGPWLTTDPPPVVNDFYELADWTGNSYDDAVILGPDETIFYYVTARNDCATDSESVPSAMTFPGCSFAGQVQIKDPKFLETVQGSYDVTVGVLNEDPTKTYALTLTFTPLAGGTSVDVNVAGRPTWTWSWNTSPLAPGAYRIQADVVQDDGVDSCTMSNSVIAVVAP